MRLAALFLPLVLLFGCKTWTPSDDPPDTPDPGDDDAAPECPDGADQDGDGYGDGCPAGDDCDDSDPNIHPDATEICDYLDNNCDGVVDEGLLNECGTCDDGCLNFDLGPFPDESDPAVDSDGVGMDGNDLVLDQSQVEYNFIWVANSYDLDQGTVSKIDGDLITEAGRYLTVTCDSNPSTPECDDIYGELIQTSYNYPSRTAVDFDFNVWVANRAYYGGIPSVTKIANDPADCIDRNGDGIKNTSADHDGDGQIDTDCNGDGVPDDLSTVCSNGLPPEYLGLDDECVLFTTRYNDVDSIGRSVCLDSGDISPEGVPYGPNNAWACTNNLTPNECHKFDGATGALEETVVLPDGVLVYGCAVDGEGILWASGGWTSPNVAYFDTANPIDVSTAPIAPANVSDHLYGITVDADDNVWFADCSGAGVWRYEPDRSSFATLGNGVWSFGYLGNGGITGIAADDRGYIWAAEYATSYVARVDPTEMPSGAEVTLSSHRWGTYGSDLRGVGVDFDGNVWAIIKDENKVYRLDVDAQGEVTNQNAGVVNVGTTPYTYSDFTGFGLRTFTNPHGYWSIIIEGCNGQPAEWQEVSWIEDEPTGTAVYARARTGVSPSILGTWTDLYETSPADLQGPPGGPVDPNPAPYLQVKLELYSDGGENTPTVGSLAVTWNCP